LPRMGASVSRNQFGVMFATLYFFPRICWHWRWVGGKCTVLDFHGGTY
jgi:ammonia channel protein AmtB